MTREAVGVIESGRVVLPAEVRLPDGQRARVLWEDNPDPVPDAGPTGARSETPEVLAHVERHRLADHVRIAEELVRCRFPEAALLRWRLDTDYEAAERLLSIQFQATEHGARSSTGSTL